MAVEREFLIIAQLIVWNLDDQLKTQLVRQGKRTRHSMEVEVRQIIKATLSGKSKDLDTIIKLQNGIVRLQDQKKRSNLQELIAAMIHQQLYCRIMEFLLRLRR